ncbi:MAG: hypothetical protein ACOCQL_04070 [Halolamina sp.]
MMNRQALATVFVTVSMVLAGCGAFAGGPSPTPTPETPSTTSEASPTPTPTTTADSRVSVYGDLPVNATLVWERVESMFGETYEPPTVTVLDGRPSVEVDSFPAHLGLGEGSTAVGVNGRYVYRNDRVQMIPRNGSPSEITRILAHEYVHAIQYRTDFVDRARESGIWRVMTEGSAVYVEDVYTREFLGFSAIERRCDGYRTGTPYERYAAQPYCFGGQYFAERLDSPTELLSPNTTLPTTTEQVLHPGTTEGPANLSVVDETPSDWYTPASMDRQGELFVRTVLGVELSEERAGEAAEGWGNDRLLSVTGDTEGYVWVLRWDTTDDADEFETAFADYLDARGERTTDGWRVDGERYRLTSVDDRTVALVTGKETFVEAVSVAEESGNVTVATE